MHKTECNTNFLAEGDEFFELSYMYDKVGVG